MGGNVSTELPAHEQVELAIACTSLDNKEIRMYRYKGTRSELEHGVGWNEVVVKEGMTIGQNRTLNNLVDDTAAGQIMTISQFDIKLGDGSVDGYALTDESMKNTLGLFIERKNASGAKAKSPSYAMELTRTIVIITNGAHRSMKGTINTLILSSPLFRMIHWSPASINAVINTKQLSYVEAPSSDDPLRTIANNAGPHSSLESMSTHDIIQFMLAYVTDYAPPYMSVANTEDPQTMLHAFSDKVKGEEYKGLYLYDKNKATIDARAEEDPRFREFVLFVLNKFLDMDLSLYGKLSQYNKLNQ